MKKTIIYENNVYRLIERVPNKGELFLLGDEISKSTGNEKGQKWVLVNDNLPLSKDSPRPIVFKHTHTLTRKEAVYVQIDGRYYELAPKSIPKLNDYVLVVANESDHFYEYHEVCQYRLVWSSLLQKEIEQFVGLLHNKGLIQVLHRGEYMKLRPLRKKEAAIIGLSDNNKYFEINSKLFIYDFDRYKCRSGDLIEMNEGDLQGDSIHNGDIFKVYLNNQGIPCVKDRQGIEIEANDYPYMILKEVKTFDE